jgi:tetratricopeptide (TPR) repeat protein
MPEPKPPDIDDAEVDEIRRVVARDHNRVTETDDPWKVLGLGRDASSAEINQRFEQYEQFYRADNFERFDDKDLTKQALEIRKRVSRAVVELQASRRSSGDVSSNGAPVLQSIDPDCRALADIYFRDGITWMKLEDLESAITCFKRSMDHDPGEGVPLAYHAFARFDREPDNSEVIAECRESFRTAAIVDPENPEVHVLRARFAIRSGHPEMAGASIENVRKLEPGHPAVGELRRRYDEMDG